MKNILKIIIISFIISVFSVFSSVSQNIGGEEIWMGWVNTYYDGLGYGSVPMVDGSSSQNIDKYGRYGFNYKTNLLDFLSYLDPEYFNRWIIMGVGNEHLIKEEFGLPEAFSIYYANNSEKVKKAEDMYMYENYYLSMKDILNRKGFVVDNHSEYIKGMIFSYTVKKMEGKQPYLISDSDSDDIIEKYNEDMIKFINELYKLMVTKFSNTENDKKKIYKERGDCLDMKDDTYLGNAGEKLVINNVVFNDKYVSNVVSTSSYIYDEFVNSGKFYDDSQKEWYYHVRHNVDFDEEFNVNSGFLDVSYASSKGIKTGNFIDKAENELVFKIINNDQNIYYIPQNTTLIDYAYKKFGSNNVAQCGGSLSCLSMAVNKLLEKRDDMLITPDKIIDKISEEKKDYNYYYNEERKGMENEIITDVCDFYGVSGSIISEDNIQPILASGGLVIARVSDCEFTTAGNFVLLSGFETVNDIQATYVIDPNIAHASYLYNLYPIDYIKSISDVLFEIRR